MQPPLRDIGPIGKWELRAPFAFYPVQLLQVPSSTTPPPLSAFVRRRLGEAQRRRPSTTKSHLAWRPIILFWPLSIEALVFTECYVRIDYLSYPLQ